MKIEISEKAYEKITRLIETGQQSSIEQTIDDALELLIASSEDRAANLLSVLEAIFDSDNYLIRWPTSVATKAMNSDTIAGIITLAIARQALSYPLRSINGSTRRMIPGSKRHFLQQHGVSSAMSVAICGAAGRIAAHPMIAVALRDGDLNDVILACDRALEDDRDGVLTFCRLDRIGKSG
ncbi:hypothetical protein ACFQI3_05080 [Hansschlegelia quercus]|uniref:Uncharacterized protein n=1 Tax=Hansschlegelia quercus TaxID=2528245 RepID=A0A4Q9GSQ7_9HYPH|nr:hypothetical protein [Hansschlegelia quercus]TBN55240.1 hypothetical protein EYR15_03675 [Hansschlegelia quercus]